MSFFASEMGFWQKWERVSGECRRAFGFVRRLVCLRTPSADGSQHCIFRICLQGVPGERGMEDVYMKKQLRVFAQAAPGVRPPYAC